MNALLAVAILSTATIPVVGELPKLEEASLDTFLTEVYGKRPVERPEELSFVDLYPPETFERNPTTRRPKRKIDAVRRVMECRYRGPHASGSFRFTAFLPKHAKGPVPAYVLICNRNPGQNIDPWRDRQTGFWPAEEIVDRGYAAIAFWNDEVAPDCYDDAYAFKAGVFRCFEDPSKPRADDAWGTLSAWAWGASRIMDWIETEPSIDAKHVAVVGHSRGGKTALVAGITDKRFAMAVANGSGCGGAKLNHTDLPASEHIHQVRSSVAYWFCRNFARWEHKDAELPFDQHQWLSLMAPRLLYVASGTKDAWAGPEAEKLATDLARPAWGARGALDVGYHCHEGKHDLTREDWNRFLDFTDAHGWRTASAEPPMADDVLLENLIRIASVSTNLVKVNEAVHYLRRRLESDGLFCRTETMPGGRQALFAANTETRTPDVLLSAHLDVVPAQTPDLFSPRREDGKIWGRGASDCKEHCVLAARLMRELKGRVSVGCLFGSDEEIGGDSTVFMLDRGYAARKLVIVMDAEQYTITTRQKGLAYYSLTRTASAAHTGLAKGVMPHAVKDLIAGYAALTEVLPESEDGSWRDVVSLLGLTGDRERAELKVSVRCARRDGWTRIESLLREKIGAEPVCLRKGEPVWLDEQAPYLVDFLARMRKRWPERNCQFYHMNSSTDARHLQRLGLPLLIIGVDARGAHTPSEHVIWKSMDEHAELIKDYLLSM